MRAKAQVDAANVGTVRFSVEALQYEPVRWPAGEIWTLFFNFGT